MKYKFLSLLFILSITVSFSQDLNGYKYVIVPKTFDFQKSADKYQLNSLTKFLFEKEGFKAVFDDEQFPEELSKNPCLALRSNVKENSNMFTTKLIIELINCSNQTVFTTEEGKSKEKDLKKGHHDALRKAFTNVKDLDYNFNSNESFKTTDNSKPVSDNIAVKEVVKEEEINNEVKTNEQLQVKQDNKTEVQRMEDMIQSEKDYQGEIYQLYSQKTPNGFQLVDNTPKIVYKLLKTSQSNYYILEGISGIAYKKDDRWYAEYYFEGKLVRKELNIKF